MPNEADNSNTPKTQDDNTEFQQSVQEKLKPHRQKGRKVTRRHIGAARTRDTSPATISNSASYASNCLAAEADSGHQVKDQTAPTIWNAVLAA